MKIDKKRLTIFLIITFLISWATALVIYLSGGLIESPIIIPALNMTFAYVLMATIYMFAPAIAHVLTRLITREGWKNVFLQLNFSTSKGFLALAWFLPGLLTLLGAILFFYLFPNTFDSNLEGFSAQLDALNAANASEQPALANPWIIVVIQFVQALLLAPILNSISTFGEEFGWRAYLLQKLLPLGTKKAVIISGLIWGVWHWPLIAMGYNYGFNYPAAPLLGFFGMTLFCLSLGTIFSWMVLRSKSVWPAVIAHSAINGVAAIGTLALKGNVNSLLGPTPVGIIGGFFFFLLAINLLIHSTALDVPNPADQQGIT